MSIPYNIKKRRRSISALYGVVIFKTWLFSYFLISEKTHILK